jgi:VIT1/CCC1 family predicted Fe2+/Mn2+ transporter
VSRSEFSGAVERYKRNFQDEIDSAAQYRAMADAEPDEKVSRIYRELGAMEEKHAHFWEERLKKANARVPPAQPSWRARVLSFIARRFGAHMVLPTIATKEYKDRNAYVGQPETANTKMVAQEHSHARVLQSIMIARASTEGSTAGGEVARVEGRHRRVGGNALRAAVLGANDGLCSNLALIMGVAGASQIGGRAVLLAGTAGLVAGAFSMAFGEWISVTSSRELAEREVGVEREELENEPEEEREELQLIYEARGFPKDEAKELAARLVEDPKNALDVLTREELGIDPSELGGSPRTAAATSFFLFAFGAAFPLAPFVFTTGNRALLSSIGISAAVLFLIGAAISVLTGRSAIRSGMRQLVIGLAAAGVTYGIGRFLGVALG